MAPWLPHVLGVRITVLTMTDTQREPDNEQLDRDAGVRRAASRPRQPRTGGEVGGMAPVQVALAVLVVFLGLLVLWWLWPLLTGT